MLFGLPVLALLYLASIAIVETFQPGAESIRTGIGLDVRQQGQALFLLAALAYQRMRREPAV
jgi:hypothetical protein